MLLILNACQGRDMPMHHSALLTNTSPTTSTQRTIIKKVNKQQIKKQNIVKEKIKRSKKSEKKEKKTVLKKVPAEKKSSPLLSIRNNIVEVVNLVLKPKAKVEVDVVKLIPKPREKEKVVKLIPKPKKKVKVVKLLPKPKAKVEVVQLVPKPKVKEVAYVKKRVVPKPTKVTSDTIIENVAQPRESFSGGGIANDLDMATIRIGKSTDYTSIIFDSYIYESKDTLPSKKSTISGTYLFTYTPSTNQIIGLLDGYHAFSALLSDQKALFSDNDVVKNIYVLKRMGTDGIKFVIQLRKKVRANIFDVKNPGRIIVNLFPL